MRRNPALKNASGMGESLLAALAWLIPVLLTVMPVFVLFWAAQEERQRARTDALRTLKERLQTAEHRMDQASTMGFWVEAATKRVQQRVSRKLRRNPGPFLDRAALATDLEQAAFQARRDLPGVKLWAIDLPIASSTEYKLLRTASFETSLAGMMTGLFREIMESLVRTSSAEPSGRDGTFARRLGALFGDGADPELFRKDSRGRAFSVVFQGESCLLAWDIIFYRDRPAVGVLAMLPQRGNFTPQALQLCLQRWQSRSIFPGFLRIPVETAAPPQLPMLHPRLIDAATDRELAPFLDLFRVVRPPIGAPGKYGDNVYTRFLTPWIGRLIPLDDRDERFLWFVPISPLAGHLGFLVATLPARGQGWLERAAGLAGILVLVGWIMVLAHACLFGRLPLPGVRGQLTWWLCGVALLPVTLAIGAGARFHSDLESNRKDALATNLRLLMRRLESGVNGLESHFAALARVMVANQRLPKLLERSRTDRRVGERIVDLLMKRFRERGFPLDGLRIHGPRETICERMNTIPSSTVRKFLAMFLERSWGEALDFWKTDSGRPFRKANSFIVQAFQNVFGWRESDDAPKYFRAGRRQYQSFRQAVFVDGLPRFQLAFLWAPENLVKPYLQRRLTEAGLTEGYPGLGLTVFQKRGGQLEEIGTTGGEGAERSDIRNIARLAIDRPVRRDGDRELLIAWPSRDLPEFIVVGHASLMPLAAELASELKWFIGMVLLLLVLIFVIARLLTERLADPVVRMTQGLLQVSEGDLGVRVAERRSDELGQSGHILDRMTGWLAERRRMSRFVAPQVLDVVAGGDPAAAMAGSTRDVAILVSDIRSFTTHSETHPPAEIFSMLNRHMERMTRVIQAEGGAIDRFIGDAIQAVFYADPKRDHPARRAVHAAYAMRLAHEELRSARKERNEFEYEIGIGIEEGKVVAGVMGDPESRLDFTVLGEPLQAAGELEAASKDGRYTRVVVSPVVAADAGSDLVFTPLPNHAHLLELVRGSEETVANVGSKPQEAPPAEAEEFDPVTVAAGHGDIEIAWKPSWSALWVVPALLFILTAGWWNREMVESERNRSLKDVRQRLRMSRALAEPSDQATRSLQDWWGRAPVADPRRTPRQVVKRWSKFSSLFPEANWYCWEARPPIEPLPDGSVLDWKPSAQELMLVGAHRAGNLGSFEPDLRTFGEFVLAYARMPFYEFPKTLYSPLSERLRSWSVTGMVNVLDIPHHKFFSFLGNARRNLVQIDIRKSTWYAAWEAWTDARGKLCGGILFLLPEKALSHELGFQCLVGNLEREGFQASVTLQQASGTRKIESPAFRRDPHLRATVGTRMKGESTGPWLVGTEKWSGDVSVRLSIARRQRKAALWANRAPALLAASGMIWLLVGGILLFAPTWGRIWAFATLRRQMLGGFLLILIPALALSFLAIERSLGERRGRVVAEEERVLHETLTAADQGIRVQRSYLLSQLTYRLTRPEVLAALAADDAAVRAKQPIPENGFKAVPTGMDWAGVPIRTMNMIGTGEVALGYNFDPRWVDLQRLFRSRTVVQLAGTGDAPVSAKASRKDLAMGSEVEDYMAILRMMIDPEGFAGWFSAPVHLIRLMTPNLGEHMYASLYLPLRGKPRWHIQAEIEEQILLKSLLYEWRDFERIGKGLFPRVTVSPVDLPAWTLADPFVHRRYLSKEPWKETGYKNMMGPILKPCSLLQGQLQRSAARSGEPVSAIVREPDGTSRLLLSMPGQEVDGQIWTAGQSLVLPLMRAEASTRRERGLLLLLTALALALAVGVARRFLQPILALADAARHVMNRDFAARIRLDRDDEFGHLATAFNHMAEGVEQGRLLSRFVSESVQDAARHAGRESAARAGEHVEVVVLFAGLQGFKDSMKELPPELLVKNLNLWLEASAAAVRAHQGEVDKFIGEKVLAVFYPSRCGSREAAQRAAIEAAREMACRLAAIEAWRGHSAGIGIVIGPALAGILGSPDVRLEFTVIGDTVNLASRLCDLALKKGGGTVLERSGLDLVQEQTALLERMETLGEITVKGKARSVECFRLPL